METEAEKSAISLWLQGLLLNYVGMVHLTRGLLRTETLAFLNVNVCLLVTHLMD